MHQEASKCRQKRSQKSQKQQVERSTFEVSYLGYHTVGFHVSRLDSSRHWEKGLTAAWGNTAKSVVLEARRGVRPATLEHPFAAASHFSLKLQPTIRQAEPTPPKGLSVKDLVEDKAVLSASFAPHTLTAASIQRNKETQSAQRNYRPLVLSLKRCWALLYHLTCKCNFFSPQVCTVLTHLVFNSSRTKRPGVGPLFFSIKAAMKNAQIQTSPNYKRTNVNAGTRQWQSAHMEESHSKRYWRMWAKARRT